MASFEPKNLLNQLRNNFKWNVPSVVLLFIVINVSLFVIYLFLTNQNLSYESLMNYLSSKGFLIITVNFLAPILLSIITFTVQQQEKRIEEKKDIIYDGINKTQEMWRDLLELASEIRYYHNEKPIEEIRLKLDAFRVTIREVKNIWDLYFYNLEGLQPKNSDYLFLLKKPIYVLYGSANTVAQLIHDNPILFEEILSLERIKQKEKCEKEKRAYQFALGIIQTNINNIYHDSILNILKNYVDIEYGDRKSKKSAEKRIRDHLNYLYMHYNELLRIEIDYNKVFSYLDNPRDIQSCFDYVEGWVRYENNRPNIKVKPEHCHRYEELLNKHRELDDKERIYSISTPYCKDCLMELANHLDFVDVERDITKRAKRTNENKSFHGKRIKFRILSSFLDN